jgi:hypothetical protein
MTKNNASAGHEILLGDRGAAKGMTWPKQNGQEPKFLAVAFTPCGGPYPRFAIAT